MLSLVGNSSPPDIYRRRRAAGMSGTPSVDELAAAIGVEHVREGGKTARRRALNQMIPPEYAEFIGREALRQIREARL